MRTIVLEFNELSPQLLDRFIEQEHLPNFRRFRDSAMVAVTDAEETAPNLEPWIQWVTVHTGLSFAEHGCFNLNEGSDLTAPRLWDLVSRADQTNWICGSMNAAVQPGFRGCFLPDPWATSAEPVPLNMSGPTLVWSEATSRSIAAGRRSLQSTFCGLGSSCSGTAFLPVPWQR